MLGPEKSALPRPRPLRLLIVDKEPAARCAFTQLCHQMTDLQIVGEVGSGGAAINAVEDLAPDVMLIDLALPDMSGFDVLRLAGNSMRPLGITTSHQSEYAERAIAEGAVDHLVKPVSADRFEHAIRRLGTDLADFGFVRIDRSILLNIRAVLFAVPVGHGTLAFTLSSGACLHSSKTYRETIVRMLPWHHCRAGSDSGSVTRP